MLRIDEKETMNIYGGTMILPSYLPDMTVFKIVKSFIETYLRK